MDGKPKRDERCVQRAAMHRDAPPLYRLSLGASVGVYSISGLRDGLLRSMPGIGDVTNEAYDAELVTMREWHTLCHSRTAVAVAPSFPRWGERGRVKTKALVAWWKREVSKPASSDNKLAGGLYSSKRAAYEVEHVVPQAWLYRTQMLQEFASADGDMHIWALESGEVNRQRQTLPLNVIPPLYAPADASVFYSNIVTPERRAAVARILCYAFLTYPGICSDAKRLVAVAGVPQYTATVDAIVETAFSSAPCTFERELDTKIAADFGSHNPFVAQWESLKLRFKERREPKDALLALLRARVQGTDLVSRVLVVRAVLDSPLFRGLADGLFLPDYRVVPAD